MDTEIISQAAAAQAVKYLFAFLNLSGDDLGLKFNKTKFCRILWTVF